MEEIGKIRIEGDDALLLRAIYMEERAAWSVILASAVCQELLAEGKIREIDRKRALL